MKKTFFLLGCLSIAFASCHSPEERAAMKAAADSAKVTENVTPHSTDEKPAAQVKEPAADTAAKTPAPKTDAPVVAAVPAVPPKPKAEMAGEGLIKQSDCLACHNATKKIVGPAYSSVAAKYEANDANIEALADKIINGGSGVWGAVPMSPHPAVSKADAKEMVKYILSLKK